MDEFLAASDMIDWRADPIADLAHDLSGDQTSDESVARIVFEWVRDSIQHSVDFNRAEVTCRASDVLTVGTGFCYAKSHLLAALLRACVIPTGFCYQRLSVSADGPPFCLHGLNAVWLKEHGWYRIDARGNKECVVADFDPPHERLPFTPAIAGEADLPEIWPAPLPLVVDALNAAQSVSELCACLPDVPLIDNLPRVTAAAQMSCPPEKHSQ